MQNTGLIGYGLQHHRNGNQLIINSYLFLFIKIVRSQHTLTAEIKEVRELVESLHFVCPVCNGDSQVVVSDPAQ